MPADFNDRTDFENADRGFIASIEPMAISDADGRRIWDMDGWAFLEGSCPDTANPSLWRQGSSTAATASSRSPRASTRCAASTSRT